MKKWLKLTVLIYLFVLSIEIIKNASVALAPSIKDFVLHNISPIKAISLGWFTTSLAQSSGAVGSVVASFAGQNIISLSTAVYILVGASLGTTITAMIISLITTSKRKKDFRHGFEIAMCYSIYSAILVILVVTLEYFFKIFSKLALLIASNIQGTISYLKIPNIVGILTDPIIKILFTNGHAIIWLFLGFGILIITLKFLSRSVIEVLGGQEKAQKFMNKHFESKYKTYFLGFIFTAIVFSSSLTIGLLVPLAAANLIGLRRTIPFILGADLGTSTDILLAALIIGNSPALATAISFFLFAIVGAIIFLPNTKLLHKTTKFTTKKLIKISRKKALYILLAFIIIPLLIILIF